MQNLARRSSGIYVVRLSVPLTLRTHVGRREIIVSTGTRELSVAKIVWGAVTTRWRQRFLDISRLIAVHGIDSMDHHEILNLTRGSPVLLTGGHLPLPLASSASGLSIDNLLRAVAVSKIGLYVRAGLIRGHLVPSDAIELVDPAAGRSAGLVIPPPRHMPAGAIEHTAEGILPVLKADLGPLATALLAGDETLELLALEAPSRPGMWFVPDHPLTVGRDALELASHEVESLRRSAVEVIEPARLQQAMEHEKAAANQGRKDGRRSSDTLSTALEDAVRYAQSNELGSELLSVCARYAEHVCADVALPIWLLDLKQAAKSPVVLTVNDVEIASLEIEGGGDVHARLEALEAERIAADAHFSEIEAAREEFRNGCFDRIMLVMNNKGKNDRSAYVLETLQMFKLQNTFRLKAGLKVPWQAIEVIDPTGPGCAPL